jgi:hypothetical protein
MGSFCGGVVVKSTYMKNKTTLAIAAALLVSVVLIAAVWSTSRKEVVSPIEQVVANDTPINVTLDFYDLWLEAARSTSTNPYQSGLAKSDILSESLRTSLGSFEGSESDQVDPVYCQIAVPEKIITKSLYEMTDKAQVLVFPKDTTLTGRSVVTLNKINEGWYIDSIDCSNGEVAPEREYSFEKEGFLLKSVVVPLDSKYWHLVYEENGIMGHAVPLFFDAESMCGGVDNNTSVCDSDKFMETTKVSIKGHMTESGVEVRLLNIIQ